MKRKIFFNAIIAASVASVFSISALTAQEHVKFSLDNVQEAIADFQQVLATRKDDWGTSTIVTNNKPGLHGRLQVVQNEKRQIFDLAVMVYSKEFAQTVGQPEGFIIDMPEGLGMLAYTKVTHGAISECHLNFAIKDSFKVNADKEEFYTPYRENMQHLFSGSKREGGARLPEYFDQRLNYGPIYFATPDYNGKSAEDGIGRRNSGYIRYYTKQRFIGYHYFSWHIGCPHAEVNYLEEGRELWVAKEGVEYDYTRASYTDPKDFWRFPVPKQFLGLMQSVANTGSQGDYIPTHKFTNKEIIKK